MNHKNLEIELTTICTLGCPGCPRNYQKHLKPQWNTGHMDYDYVRWLAYETDFWQYQFVGCYGDPIYHPNIVEIMELFVKQGKRFTIETNASNTKPELWDKIHELELNDKVLFTFSVDGLEDTNHIYRKRSKWKDIEYAMSQVLSMKHKPTTLWKWIEFPYNQHQTETARKLANDIGFDRFQVRRSTRWKPYAFDNVDDMPQYLFPEQLQLWRDKWERMTNQ